MQYFCVCSVMCVMQLMKENLRIFMIMFAIDGHVRTKHILLKFNQYCSSDDAGRKFNILI